MSDGNAIAIGTSCVRCAVPFELGEKVAYNSESEPGHIAACEPSEEYATEQVRRLRQYLANVGITQA